MNSAVQVANVDPTKLRPSPRNPRRTGNFGALKELVESIRTSGIIQPPVVRPVENHYEIVCGHRRVEAARHLDLREIKVIVRELTDEEAVLASVTENLARADLAPIDEALAVEALQGTYDTTEGIADAVGKSARWVARRLALLNLSDALRMSLEVREFAVEWYEVVARVDHDRQEEVLNEARSTWGPKTAQQVRARLTNGLIRLQNAPFDLQNPELIGGACVHCQYCSLSQKLLFDDDEPATCSNRECYNEKSVEFARQVAEREGIPIIESDDGIVVSFEEGEGLTRAVWAFCGSWRTPGSIVWIGPRNDGAESGAGAKTARELFLEKARKKLKIGKLTFESWKPEQAPYYDGETFRLPSGEELDFNAEVERHLKEKPLAPGQIVRFRFESEKAWAPGFEPAGEEVDA